MKMSSKTRFRRILLTSVALGIASIPASTIDDLMLPDELVAFNESRFEQDISTAEIVAMVVALSLAIAALINIVALYRFRPNARPWAIGITVAFTPLFIVLGPWVDSGIGELLTIASSMVWGVVLAMMYCQPYAELFAPNASDPERQL